MKASNYQSTRWIRLTDQHLQYRGWPIGGSNIACFRTDTNSAAVLLQHRRLPALRSRSDIGVHQRGPEPSSAQTPAVGSHEPRRHVQRSHTGSVWRCCRLCSPLAQVARGQKPQRDGAPQQGSDRDQRSLMQPPLARPLRALRRCRLHFFFSFETLYHGALPISACSFQLVAFCLCSSKAFRASYPQNHLAFLPSSGRSGNFQTLRSRQGRITPNSTVQTLRAK